MRLKKISKWNKPIIFTLIPLFSLGIYLYQKPTTLELSRQSYHDKFHGFWLGQSISNWTGLITENFGVKKTDILILCIIDLPELGGSKLITDQGYNIGTLVSY